MHVLHKLHRTLRPGGLILDIHPEPQRPEVEVILGGADVMRLGEIDTSSLIANVRAARATMTSLVETGWFNPERTVLFDFVSHFRSVDEWLRHRKEQRSSGLLDPAMASRARELLAEGTGEIRICERVVARRSRRGAHHL